MFVWFLSAMDDVESPRNRLEVAINEERSLSAREAAVAQQAAEEGERERAQKQPHPHPISPQLSPSRWNRR
ncbi:hypothetical protein M0R45_013884 [Rubus argutus]|uniref:Uncharacterized protein n=1 Tax=Rubus argutus TaxID=59490 RepID=A0AAW1XN81_RUBAR